MAWLDNRNSHVLDRYKLPDKWTDKVQFCEFYDFHFCILFVLGCIYPFAILYQLEFDNSQRKTSMTSSL